MLMALLRAKKINPAHSTEVASYWKRSQIPEFPKGPKVIHPVK